MDICVFCTKAQEDCELRRHSVISYNKVTYLKKYMSTKNIGEVLLKGENKATKNFFSLRKILACCVNNIQFNARILQRRLHRDLLKD
jgi:hypothetical protein